jgi:RNA polymerase sigma-70 factor, ECF subfamily
VEADEFDELYRGTVRRLIGQLYLLTGDADEAQDVVQEAFVRAWERRRQLADVSSPEAWIRVTAQRLAINRWRRRGLWSRLARRHGVPADVTGPSPDRTAVVTALQRLPEVQRVAIVLHHLCDLSVEQVAAETRVAVGTVKARLSRGRQALAQHLNDEEMQEIRHA